MNTIEVFKGDSGKWHWRIVSPNSQIHAVSETYFSKWNAKRAGKKLAKANGFAFRVIE